MGIRIAAVMAFVLLFAGCEARLDIAARRDSMPVRADIARIHDLRFGEQVQSVFDEEPRWLLLLFPQIEGRLYGFLRLDDGGQVFRYYFRDGTLVSVWAEQSGGTGESLVFFTRRDRVFWHDWFDPVHPRGYRETGGRRPAAPERLLFDQAIEVLPSRIATELARWKVDHQGYEALLKTDHLPLAHLQERRFDLTPSSLLADPAFSERLARLLARDPARDALVAMIGTNARLVLPDAEGRLLLIEPRQPVSLAPGNSRATTDILIAIDFAVNGLYIGYETRQGDLLPVMLRDAPLEAPVLQRLFSRYEVIPR